MDHNFLTIHLSERHDSIKYIPACTQSPVSCGATCKKDAPIVLIPTYPCAAKVDGNNSENAFQNIGMLDSGQAMPVRNNSIMLKAGNIISAASRLRKNAPIVIEKNSVASMKGTISAIRDPMPPICGRPKIRGIRISPYIERPVYMIK